MLITAQQAHVIPHSGFGLEVQGNHTRKRAARAGMEPNTRFTSALRVDSGWYGSAPERPDARPAQPHSPGTRLQPDSSNKFHPLPRFDVGAVLK